MGDGVSEMLLIAIAVVLGLLVVLLAISIDRSVMRPRRVLRGRLVPQPLATGAVHEDVTPDETEGRLALARRLPMSVAARDRMSIELRRAGLPLKASEYLAIRMGFGLAASLSGALTATALSSSPLVVGGVGFVSLLAGWGLPAMYVARKQRSRRSKIEKQLPDALTAVAKSLRAGSGLLQALKYSASETPAPLGAELQRTLRDLELGGDTQAAFDALVERTQSSDLGIVATAIMIQRSVGGNLSEILTNVTRTIRERSELRAEVNVLTSKQRLTGNMVAVLPVFVAAAFTLLNPDMGGLLFSTVPGRIALAVAAGFELFGLFLIRRLARVEV